MMRCFSPSQERVIAPIWESATSTRFVIYIRARAAILRFGITSGKHLSTTGGFASTISCCRRNWRRDWRAARLTRAASAGEAVGPHPDSGSAAGFHEMARWSVFLHSAAKDFAVGGQLLSDR